MSIFCNLIFDANVLTYLYELGLLETCVKAVEHPFTLDLIRDVELKRMPWADVVRREVGVLSLDEKMMGDAVSYMSDCRGLSFYDAGLIVLGKCFGFPVFTEDKKMIRELLRLGLKHVSLLEVVEALVSAKCISCGVGVDSVDAIASKLLPGRYNKECGCLRKSFLA